MIYSLKKVMGSKAWDIIWLACGWGALIIATLLPIIQGQASFDIWTAINLVGAILAPLIVNLMANQKIKLGSGIGIIGAGLDVANYFRLGIMGSVMTAIWAFITYIKGFITFGKQTGEFKASKTSKKDLITCAVVAVIGCAIVVWLYYIANPASLPDFISSQVAGMQKDPTWFQICNILLIVSMMVSQYLLTAGNASAWFAWIVTNAFQVITTAYSAFALGQGPAYFVVSIMFVFNTIKGCVMWYEPKDSKVNA